MINRYMKIFNQIVYIHDYRGGIYMSFTEEIKNYALDLGYCGVGCISIDAVADYVEILKSRNETYDFLIRQPQGPMKGAIPKVFMPEAKSIIVLAWDYFQKDFPKTLTEKIGRAYLSRSYHPLENSINGARVKLMEKFLVSKGCKVNTNINVPARWASAKAGVTTFGKNNFAYVNGVGSFIIIYTIVIDQKLDYDQPTMNCQCPQNCRACMAACPTAAIYEPFKLNPYKCLGFNAWMRQEKNNIPTVIPEGIREKMGTRVHGCDLCQEACPRNRKKLKSQFPKDQFLEKISRNFTLIDLLHITDDFYRKNVYPIMYNYIEDYKYFKRNAAVAIGNTGDSGMIPELAKILDNEDEDELVRIHVAWAIGHIGGKKAKQVLLNRLDEEQSIATKQEIISALNNCSV